MSRSENWQKDFCVGRKNDGSFSDLSKTWKSFWQWHGFYMDDYVCIHKPRDGQKHPRTKAYLLKNDLVDKSPPPPSLLHIGQKPPQ